MKVFFLVFSLITIAPLVYGQSSGESEVEALYDDIDNKEIERVEKKREERKSSVPLKEVLKLEDLAELEPFDDIAVIQRKFLPKTSRFETAFSGVLGLNNAFFTNVGLSARLSYYFSEKWGIDANYFYFSSSSRDITDSLRDKQGINTKTLVEAESYMGAAVKWVPIYGKMSFLNERIVPFDIYFAPGFGVTTTALGDSASTISLGTGQVFAISKSTAFRWDFVWNIYQAEVLDSTSSTGKTTKMQNDLYISMGMTFFFPEAKYR